MVCHGNNVQAICLPPPNFSDMTTRKEAIGLLSSISVSALRSGSRAANAFAASTVRFAAALRQNTDPRLAPGTPMSPERLALIASFKARSDGISDKFEARMHNGDWAMPYRLFRPVTKATLPLVVYLHGSGGLGNDNEKQMGLGNIFGTRVWAMPENQKKFPCYVVAPQTDRGWVRYGAPAPGDSIAQLVPGLGDGAALVFELIDSLRNEFAIDERRIYITGQSMGGAGVWHLTAQRPKFFAAAVPCCAGVTAEPAASSVATPMWSFHGSSDTTVPVQLSRDRIAAVRKAGGHALYTEYAGVDHNSWEWAYTEPELVPWVFSKRREA
jgi:predicted peptidase